MSHITHDELNRQLAEANKKVVVGDMYKHYKYPDREYYVEKLAIQESTEKICVIYKDIKSMSAPSFVRDLDSWLEIVEWEGKYVSRFVLAPQK